MYYSQTSKGFYDTAIHGDNIPDDAVEITADEHTVLMQGQSDGKRIVPDATGRPILIDPPPPEPFVPYAVSRFQARAALHLAGLLDQVEALMAAPEADMLARLAWQDAQEFRRHSPTVAAMGTALGLDDAQLDALFTTAAGIEA